MADYDFGGTAVLGGSLLLPLHGRWIAYNLALDDTQSITGTHDLADADRAFVAHGTVRRGGEYALRGSVSIVAGVNGIANTIPSRFYRAVPARTVLQDICRETGETLSATSSNVIGRTLTTWTRRAGTGSDAVQAVASALGLSWRFLLDGSLWLGSESWPDVPWDNEVIDRNPAAETIEFVLDVPDPRILPGVTFQGQRVVQVEHALSTGQCTTTLTVDPTGADPQTGVFAELADAATADRVYHAMVPAEVVSQAADGTLALTLEPDTDAPARVWPPMTGIAILGLAPGVTATVAAGARVLVGFMGGDPTQPYATAWGATPTNLTGLKIGANATKGVARLDDTTTDGSLAATSLDNALTLTYTPPTGSPQSIVITFTNPTPGTIVVAAVGGPANIVGEINSASAITKVE